MSDETTDEERTVWGLIRLFGWGSWRMQGVGCLFAIGTLLLVATVGILGLILPAGLMILVGLVLAFVPLALIGWNQATVHRTISERPPWLDDGPGSSSGGDSGPTDR